MEEFKKPSVFKPPAKTIENEEKKTDTNSDLIQKISTQKTIPTIPKAECPYLEPKWSQTPVNEEIEYKFEVLKSGSIIEEVKNLQTKPYWVIGRLDQNDIPMAHPTISRFHAVFQYRPKIECNSSEDSEKEEKDKSKIESGWYVYDLGSTHGTFLNKARIPTKTYIRVHVGHMLKFGASLRSFILQGPDYDEEPESELTVTELKERRKQEEELKKEEQKMQEEQREKEGISWGMMEDADEETDLSVNPYATTNNEELFLDDPKKTLRGFFEREGLTLDYKCDEMSPGTFVCRVELPIDDNNGKPITAEVCHKGKKKDCVVQCALEACRILDRHGVLRQSHHEPLKRKAPKPDSDDEDDFLDRTGDIERKKLRKANAGQTITLTYEDLIKQEEEMVIKLQEVENEIATYQENTKQLKESKPNVEDDLDNYMENLTKKSVNKDKTEIRKIRVEQQRLKAEIQKTKKLIKIAKPFDLPPISGLNKISTEKKLASLPLFGKRNKFKFTVARTETETSAKELKSDEEEYDDDESKKTDIKKKDKNIREDKSKLLTSNKDANDINIDKETELSDDIKTNVVKNKITKLYGPAFIPKEILNSNIDEDNTKKTDDLELNKFCKEINEESDNNCSKTNISENNLESESIPELQKTEHIEIDKSSTEEMIEDSNDQQDSRNVEINEMDGSSQTNKKRKSRTRNKHRRENVDIDDYDEYIDSQKQSEWIPPKNQSGDGRTSLNDKFGY